MDDFNLIPNEFLQRKQKLRMLKLLGSTLGALVFMLGGLAFIAHQKILQNETTVARLLDKKAQSMQQRARLDSLREQREVLQAELLLLDSLRSGAPMSELVSTIESSVEDGKVWFVSWQFRRTGITIEDDPEPRTPSYFVMAKDPKDFPKQWESQTHMTIKGEAKDHAALSSFVQRLFKHAAVADVRVQRSAAGETSVAFDLAVVVSNPGAAT